MERTYKEKKIKCINYEKCNNIAEISVYRQYKEYKKVDFVCGDCWPEENKGRKRKPIIRYKLIGEDHNEEKERRTVEKIKEWDAHKGSTVRMGRFHEKRIQPDKK